MLTRWTDEAFTLVGNRVPVPLEELDDDLWGESFRWATSSGMPEAYLFQSFALELVRLPRGRIEMKERIVRT